MVFLVNGAHCAEFSSALDHMHRVRKRVFVDWLGWEVPVVNGALEIDNYDTDDAVYLLNLHAETKNHLASVRLLPSTGPHILGDLFDCLCEGGAPCEPETWEITRLCTTPGLDKAVALKARQKLAVALVEFALMQGIKRYTCVIQIEHLPALLAPGWETTPLGAPKTIDGQLVGAFSLGIAPHTLQQMQERWGGAVPVLHSNLMAAA